LWALTLAGGAAVTTNPLLLALVATVALTVAVARRGRSEWALTLRLYVWLAVCVVIIRVGFRIVFGAAGGGAGPVALSLPAWHLPGVVREGGLVLFGPVTWDGLYWGLRDGMRLGCLILAVGSANVLASPKRVLASLPGALRQVGTAVVVALTLFPSLALSVSRVRRAARLRGGTGTPRKSGIRPGRTGSRGSGAGQGRWQALHRVIFPVLADSLDRSLILAASLEARGYGATSRLPSRAIQQLRALAAVAVMALTAAGALAVTGGRPAMGWLILAAAASGGAGLLNWLGRDVGATRLSREPWNTPDWRITVCAVIFVLGWAASSWTGGAEVLDPGGIAWPSLPWPALLGLAAMASPLLWTAPPGPVSSVGSAGSASAAGSASSSDLAGSARAGDSSHPSNAAGRPAASTAGATG
jgi:energy-coupling factor transport system permease protein